MRAHAVLIILHLACAVPCGAQERILVLVGADARKDAAAGLERGVRAALEAVGWDCGVELRHGAGGVSAGGLEGTAGCLLHLPTSRARTAARAAAAAGVPAFDLGGTTLSGKTAPLDPHADQHLEVEATLWWLTGPLAHHDVAVFHGRDRSFREQARSFHDLLEEHMPGHGVTRLRRLPSSPKALVRLLQRNRSQGFKACYVSGTPEEARVLARAAREVTPPLVVVVASAGLGFDEAGEEDGGARFPEGTIVMDRDLPGETQVEAFPDSREILAMEGPGGPWALGAFDAVVALRKARKLAGSSEEGVLELLRSGRAKGTRGAFSASGGKPDPGALGYIPLMVVDGRLRPFPPMTEGDPGPRPRRVAYQPKDTIGTFSQWNTFRFKPRRGSTVLRFTFGGPDVRTIEKDLKAFGLCTGGKLPAVDHLVREKLMTRLMSVTAEKFLLNEDGGPVPGRSLDVSLVYDWDGSMERRAKRVWPVFVAKDDAEAGGRAFGDHCYVYSTFIQRTIFSERSLVEGPIGFGDLVTLTGIGRDREKEYIFGTREDNLYRLVEAYAGAMALTAAHEVGHLAGLGHDTESPTSIMNVEEGAGIHHSEGKFTPRHLEQLSDSLKTVPAER